MSAEFNLIDSPWIRVRYLDGRLRDVSLRQAFSEAGQIQRLAGELPTQDFAVLRILLAICYRALDDEEQSAFDAWSELWNADELPKERLSDYFETWHDRFDLFHPERPFMQVPDLHNAKRDWRSIDLLVPDSPGPGALFRRSDPAEPLAPGDAARWLVHCHSFDVSGIKSGAVGDPRVKGGRGYPTPVGWCGWMGGQVVEGENLKDTLLLNLVLDREIDDRDIPLWEEEKHLTSAERDVVTRGPHGPISLLTWPARRVRLHRVGETVPEVLVCNGDPIDYTAQYGREFMTPWRYSEPQSRKAKRDVYMPRALTPGRALWRGLETLLPDTGARTVAGRSSKVPAGVASGVIQWIRDLTGVGLLKPDFELRLSATSIIYGPQMAVIDTIAADRLVFKSSLTSPAGVAHRHAAFSAVAEAEEGVRALRNLANNLAIAAGGDPGGPGDRAEADAFFEIDTHFRTALRRLSHETSPDAWRQEWRDSTRSVLTRRGRSLVDAAPPAAWRGREHRGHVVSIGTAEAWFMAALRRVLPFAATPAVEEDHDSGSDTNAVAAAGLAAASEEESLR